MEAKHKKVRIICTVIISIFLLSGCEYEVKLTDEESGQLSEYMAYLILQNEDGYNGKLVTEDMEAEDPAAKNPITITPAAGVAEPKPTKAAVDKITSSIEGNIKSNEVFTELLNYDGLTIKYDSYEITDKITDGLTELKAEAGTDYIAVYFSITNTARKKIKIDFSDKKITYQLKINASAKSYNSEFNLLLNEIKFLNTEIASDSSYRAVALFKISEQAISTLDAVITDGNTSMIYKLK